MGNRFVFIVAALFLSVAAGHANAGTLQDVQAKGFVQCGVSQGLPGFSAEENGNWVGIDVDFCRAVAAAIFGDPDKVKYTPLSARARFASLLNGEIDILSRNSTWTMGFDTRFGIDFVGTWFYDNQGFMVPESLNIRSVLELSSARVCVGRGTTAALNVADFFRDRKMEIELIEYDEHKQLRADYEAGKCHAYAADVSRLYATRMTLAESDKHVVLQETISKEPLGPVVHESDREWYDIVKWVLFALINAEELEVSSTNVDQLRQTGNSAIKRLLGAEGDFGALLGLGREDYEAADWAYNAIKTVGNYGEIYDRHLGVDGTVPIPRGPNHLWSKGGLHYAPPIR